MKTLRYTPTRVFSKVPFPGHPLGIAVYRNTVYVATHRDSSGGPSVPSHVYAFNVRGDLVQDWTIQGQDDSQQGLSGIAVDRSGLLYLVDQAPPRVITLDPRTGAQTLYAEFPDVPLCSGKSNGSCSKAKTDRPPQPINCVFGPEGSLYVGDLTQALIWKVPPGGDYAEVWYTSEDLDSLFGPNTLRFLDRGRTMILSESAHNLQNPRELFSAKGRLHTLRILPDGTIGERSLLWEGGPGDTPDGFSVGRSGNIYVALAVSSTLLVLDPCGREIIRIPASLGENRKLRVPYNLPGGTAFWGDKLMVTNQCFFGGYADHQVVFSVDVGERGRRLFYPRIAR